MTSTPTNYRDRTGDAVPTDRGLVVVKGRHHRNTKSGAALWVTEVRQGDRSETRIFRSYELTAMAKTNGLTAQQCADLGAAIRDGGEDG